MNSKPRILIVEDEAPIRNGLVDVFVYHGFQVEAREEGLAGLHEALGGKYDLVLLDVMLPGMDGFEICNRIRQKDRDQAIIMLTAKSSDEDIIEGLSLGADDYVAKPFSVAQLVLRVQAVLRRSRSENTPPKSFSLGAELEIDPLNLCAIRNGAQVALTRREAQILQYLHRNSARPVPRDELLNQVWGYARGVELETRTVDIHIAKLRRKIEAEPASPRHLVTVRGAGYRLMEG